MDAELRRLHAEVAKWGDYEVRLANQGKQATHEYELVRERFLSVCLAREGYVSAMIAKRRPRAARSVPSGSPSQEPPRNRRGNRPRKQKQRVIRCDVRHMWPLEGLGPCQICGAQNPWMVRAEEAKKAKEATKDDPAIAIYETERAKRSDIIGGVSRRPAVAVPKSKRMQAVWEAQ